MTRIEIIDRKLDKGNKYQITDQAFLAKISADKSAREAKINKILTWVTVVGTIVGAIATVMALF